MRNWDNYRLILALHQNGTLRGAAQALGINHATVSRRLSQINADNKAPVFEKITGGYQATDIGLEYVTAARQFALVALKAERRSRALSENISGRIRVSISEPMAQILLQSDLFRFTNEHPNIELFVETSVNLINLDHSEADIVVRATDFPPEHLVGRRLFPYYLSDYCSKDYLANTPYETRQWLRYSNSPLPENWITTTCHPDASVGLQSNDLMFLLTAAEAGHGMIRTACYMGDNNPLLMRLSDKEPLKGPDVWVLTHPDLKRTKRIKFAMKHLADALEAKQALMQGKSN